MELGMAEKILDATGLSCPLPILKASKALRAMETGQTLELLANDPSSKDDVPDFCQSAGHQLLETSELERKVYRFVIRKGNDRN
jgi:tRNA 2-thiouridine synthesizing protein A